MTEKVVLGTFIYLAIGFGIGMFLDTVYDIDIPIGSTFFWPIIIMFVAILDVINLTRSLIKPYRNRRYIWKD